MPEGLLVNGTLELHRPGFCTVENLEVLWPGPPARGRNRTLGHRNGAIAYPRRNAERPVALSLVIEGALDSTGAPHATPGRAGLEANLELLRTYFDPNDDPATVAITLALTMPSGAVRTGPATVEDFPYAGVGPTAVRAALDLTLVDGYLA